MNIEKLNQWGMIAANLGVLASIIFLGIEIQQNTTMTRSQTRDAMTDKQMVFYQSAMDNIEAESMYRELNGDLEKDENYFNSRKNFFLNLSQLRMWENELYQYRQGLFDATEFESRLNVWKAVYGGDTKYSEEYALPAEPTSLTEEDFEAIDNVRQDREMN